MDHDDDEITEPTELDDMEDDEAFAAEDDELEPPLEGVEEEEDTWA